MSDQQSEVQRWIELLQSKAQEDKLKAASQLGRMGVRTRGAAISRGSLAEPAEARMGKEQLNVALKALSGTSPETKREVAFALGEWADEVAVTVLSELAYHDEDWRVRAAAVDALAKIGGQSAMETLLTVARKDPYEDVRSGAINGLGNLALASVSALSAPSVRTRGAVRTRGVAPSPAAQAVRRDNPGVERILKLLEEMRQYDPSQYVRSIADSTLAGLGG